MRLTLLCRTEKAVKKLHEEAETLKKRRRTRVISLAEDWVRSVDLMITKNPKFFGVINDYVYNRYDRFILPFGEGDKSYPVVIMKSDGDPNYSSSIAVIPEEVQELSLLKIEKYLREFRQAVQEGKVDRPMPM